MPIELSIAVAALDASGIEEEYPDLYISEFDKSFTIEDDDIDIFTKSLCVTADCNVLRKDLVGIISTNIAVDMSKILDSFMMINSRSDIDVAVEESNLLVTVKNYIYGIAFADFVYGDYVNVSGASLLNSTSNIGPILELSKSIDRIFSVDDNLTSGDDFLFGFLVKAKDLLSKTEITTNIVSVTEKGEEFHFFDYKSH